MSSQICRFTYSIRFGIFLAIQIFFVSLSLSLILLEFPFMTTLVCLIVSHRPSRSLFSHTEGRNIINPSCPQHIDSLGKDVDARYNVDKPSQEQTVEIMESWLYSPLEILLARLIFGHREKHGGLPQWSSTFLLPPYSSYTQHTITNLHFTLSDSHGEDALEATCTLTEMMICPLLYTLSVPHRFKSL